MLHAARSQRAEAEVVNSGFPITAATPVLEAWASWPAVGANSASVSGLQAKGMAMVSTR